jgi:hypothetical protein
MRNDFCIFILTHGRVGRVATIKALRSFRYTGRTYLVVDDEDKDLPAYQERYGERVLVFSKKEIEGRFDVGDNLEGRSGVIYARNVCWDLARRVGARYFMQLDDDYTGFYIRRNARGIYGTWRVDSLDTVLEAMIEYLAATPALTIAMSQGGDHMGDSEANQGAFTTPLRKAMNTFLCDVERPFTFMGRVNEDTTAYVDAARRGELMLTIPTIQVNQGQTQKNPGGMTTIYLDYGTYLKSFYSVMYIPSAVKIAAMSGARSHARGAAVGEREWRIHHVVNWRHAAVAILDPKYRKPDAPAV